MCLPIEHGYFIAPIGGIHSHLKTQIMSSNRKFKKVMNNADRVIKKQKELQEKRERMAAKHAKIREKQAKRWG